MTPASSSLLTQLEQQQQQQIHSNNNNEQSLAIIREEEQEKNKDDGNGRVSLGSITRSDEFSDLMELGSIEVEPSFTSSNGDDGNGDGTAIDRIVCVPKRTSPAELLVKRVVISKQRQQQDSDDNDNEKSTRSQQVSSPCSCEEQLQQDSETLLVGSAAVQSNGAETPDAGKDDGEDADASAAIATEESKEISYADSMIESLSFACINTCGSATGEPPTSACGGLPLYTKGILRRKTNSRGSTYGGEVHNPNQPTALLSSDARAVSFSRLEIHEFDMTLGNHPSAVSGPPVMLDWDNECNDRVVGVDEYERSRIPRRDRRQLKLSYKDRKAILIGDGKTSSNSEGKNGTSNSNSKKKFSEKEVNDAWAEALRIRQQRKETLNRGLILMMIDDFMESASRKYHRLMAYFGFSSSSSSSSSSALSSSS